MKILIDFETYSELDLKVVGAYKYARHPSTKILMMSYYITGCGTHIWEPGEPWPELLSREPISHVFAHNAIFEYLIWTFCGEIVGMPPCPNLDQFIDIMARCGKFSYPLGLDKAAKALNVATKDTEGMRLIKKFSKPTGHNKHNSPDDWKLFKDYCIQDTNTARAVLNALPKMTHEERAWDQLLWTITQEINLRGVPVDVEGAAAVYRYVEAYKESHNERMPELTNGVVTKPTQVQRIKKWCEAEGYPMPDGLGAQLIEDALEGPNPPPEHVAEVLEMRKEFGSSSANKFKLAIDLEYNGRVHGCLIKNGASTGRYASRNFQLHNLARLKPLEDPDVLFQKFKDIEEIDRPFKAAKSLVRAIIKAQDCHKLCVADWSGIETCLLFWFVDDRETLAVLHDRGDLYKVMAAAVYNCSVEDVDRDTQRPLGKALILGCGYGMGYRRFKEAAKSFGLDVTLPESNMAVNKYRQKFPEVQRSWYKLAQAARQAILNPGKEIPCYKVSFLFDGKSLWTKLPSGRRLHYPEACIKEGDIQYMGVRNSHWTSLRLTPSQIIENIIQAMAADILEGAIVKLNDKVFSIIFHVHDEIVCEEPADRLEELIDIMCQVPWWAEGLPLFAEGYISERFKK